MRRQQLKLPIPVPSSLALPGQPSPGHSSHAQLSSSIQSGWPAPMPFVHAPPALPFFMFFLHCLLLAFLLQPGHSQVVLIIYHFYLCQLVGSLLALFFLVLCLTTFLFPSLLMFCLILYPVLLHCHYFLLCWHQLQH